MTFEYVRVSGAPTMWPRVFSGVGTVDEAGRWSTRFVLKNDSVVYSRICFVYPSSFDDALGTVVDSAFAELRVRIRTSAAHKIYKAEQQSFPTTVYCHPFPFI